MTLEDQLKEMLREAIRTGDQQLEQACRSALQRLPAARRSFFRGPPPVRGAMRRNPPLDDHMADESYDDIFHALAQRIMQEPVDAVEFAYSVLDTAKEGLLRYSDISVEEDEQGELSKVERHLEKALLCIRKALEKLDA
jgi:hypothetical protein